MQNIYRKNNLARNLNKMRKILPDIYEFYPMTWTLPLEKNDFLAEFKKRKQNNEDDGYRHGRYVIKNGIRRPKNFDKNGKKK